jgi:hypothetical protein
MLLLMIVRERQHQQLLNQTGKTFCSQVMKCLVLVNTIRLRIKESSRIGNLVLGRLAQPKKGLLEAHLH